MKKYDGLRDFLRGNTEGYEEVFFNEKGEWLFCADPKYPLRFSRDEVLSDSFETKFEKQAKAEEKSADAKNK